MTDTPSTTLLGGSALPAAGLDKQSVDEPGSLVGLKGGRSLFSADLEKASNAVRHPTKHSAVSSERPTNTTSDVPTLAPESVSKVTVSVSKTLAGIAQHAEHAKSARHRVSTVSDTTSITVAQLPGTQVYPLNGVESEDLKAHPGSEVNSSLNSVTDVADSIPLIAAQRRTGVDDSSAAVVIRKQGQLQRALGVGESHEPVALVNGQQAVNTRASGGMAHVIMDGVTDTNNDVIAGAMTGIAPGSNQNKQPSTAVLPAGGQVNAQQADVSLAANHSSALTASNVSFPAAIMWAHTNETPVSSTEQALSDINNPALLVSTNRNGMVHSIAERTTGHVAGSVVSNVMISAPESIAEDSANVDLAISTTRNTAAPADVNAATLMSAGSNLTPVDADKVGKVAVDINQLAGKAQAEIESRQQGVSTGDTLPLNNMFHALSGGTITAPLGQRSDAGLSGLISAPYTVPLLEPDADQSLSGNIRWMANDGVKNATINIAPSGMGPITVQVEINDDKMNVSIMATQNGTREALDAMLPRLREQLSAQGFDSVRLDVSDGRSDGSRHNGHQQFNQARAELMAGDQGSNDQRDPQQDASTDKSSANQTTEIDALSVDGSDTADGMFATSSGQSRYDAYV